MKEKVLSCSYNASLIGRLANLDITHDPQQSVTIKKEQLRSCIIHSSFIGDRWGHPSSFPSFYTITVLSQRLENQQERKDSSLGTLEKWRRCLLLFRQPCLLIWRDPPQILAQGGQPQAASKGQSQCKPETSCPATFWCYFPKREM